MPFYDAGVLKKSEEAVETEETAPDQSHDDLPPDFGPEEHRSVSNGCEPFVVSTVTAPLRQDRSWHTVRAPDAMVRRVASRGKKGTGAR